MMLSICLSVRLLPLPHVFSQVKNLSHREICVCGGGLTRGVHNGGTLVRYSIVCLLYTSQCAGLLYPLIV